MNQHDGIHESHDFDSLFEKGQDFTVVGQGFFSLSKKKIQIHTHRYLTFTSDLLSHRYGKRVEIDLHKVIRLQKGAYTYKMNEFATSITKHVSTESNNALCFSLIYHKKNKIKTLDLIAPSEEISRTWFVGIQVLLDEYSNFSARTSSSLQFTHYMFETYDSDKKYSILDL